MSRNKFPALLSSREVVKDYIAKGQPADCWTPYLGTNSLKSLRGDPKERNGEVQVDPGPVGGSVNDGISKAACSFSLYDSG